MKAADVGSCDCEGGGKGVGVGGDAKRSNVADSLFIPRGASGAFV